MKPKFSIITAAYNAEKYIDITIESVINQTYNNWEMIIVDDGSTDETVCIVQKYCKIDGRIKLMKQENKKQAAARNTGIKESNGQWVCFLDSDDYWMPEMLQTQTNFIGSTNADVFYTGGYKFNILNEAKEEYSTLYGSISGEKMYKELYKANPIPIQSIAINAAMIKKIGLQDERPEIVGCEDLDYWIRLSIIGARFYGIKEHQFMYRMHDDNISKNSFQMRLAMITALIKNFNAKLFTRKEVVFVFYKRFDPLLMDLVKLGRVKQAESLLKAFRKIHSGIYLKMNHFILSQLGKHSYYFIKFINKINRTIERKIVDETIVNYL